MQTIVPLPKPGFESGASASSRKADEQTGIEMAFGMVGSICSREAHTRLLRVHGD